MKRLSFTHCETVFIVYTVESGYIIHGQIIQPLILHFRPEPNFYIIKLSGYITQSSGYIGHFERCEREHLCAESRTNCPDCRCGCLRDTFPGSHSQTCLQTRVIVFHSCETTPTKRTSLTWKENVVILAKLKLLKHDTSQRSAAERLDLIGFGCFAQYGRH